MIAKNEQAPIKSHADYVGYKGLPPLVGLHTMDEALSIGLTIEESVGRIKRLHWALRRLHQIFIARLSAMPVYELKMAFSLHAFYCAEHATTLRERVREMRQPPYGLDESPDKHLDNFFDELLDAPAVAPLVFGVYGKAIPAVVRALDSAMADVNRLFDHPTHRLCKLARVEIGEIEDYGRQAAEKLVSAEEKAQLEEWGGTLDRLLAAAGGLDGTGERSDEAIGPVYAGKPFVYDGRPQRDERFIDPYNQGVNPEAMLFDPEIEPLPKTLMLYFKRMREIDVPEMMSSIIHETTGKPWNYYRDMTRQLWDEARHAMMGEIGFVSVGLDWTKIPINITWSLNLNTKLTPLQRHAILFHIEQGLMPKNIGKEYEWEVAVASANRLAQLIQDFDWADEILHARIGRDWLVPQFGSQSKAQESGYEYLSSTFEYWKQNREMGLTEHRDWWPEVYDAACRFWGVRPDPHVRAFQERLASEERARHPVAAE